MPNFDGMNPVSNPMNPNVSPVIQASVASLANPISSFITTISGAAAVTGFRLPRGFRGIFVVMPTGAFTGVTGGVLAYSADGETEDIPIGKAFTAVVGGPALFVSDGKLVYALV